MKRALSVLLVLVCACVSNAALTMTTTTTMGDNWTAVAADTLVTGAAIATSDSYATIINVEMAASEATAITAGEVTWWLEISADGYFWQKMPVGGAMTAETPAATTINDAAVAADDTALTLTDATTGDFDERGRKWLIIDGTLANSESVRTKSNSTHTVTTCATLKRNHANGLTVIDRVEEWSFVVPFGAAKARVVVLNEDADCDVVFSSSVMKVTALN